jgi:phage tail-like protein
MANPKRNDPFKSFNFIVEIDGNASAGFTECSGLSSETTVIEYREGSDKGGIRKFPGLRKYNNVTLKRGLTANRDLWNWYKSVIDGASDRRNVSIILLADDRTEVARFTLSQAWPCKWVGPALNAKGNDIAIEELELAHEGFDFES